MRIGLVIMILTYLALGNVAAQNSPDSLLPVDNRLIPLPSVHLNVGFNHAFSDVILSKSGPSPFRQLGYQLTIVQRAAKFLNVGFELYSGTIYGEEQRGTTNLNYRTSIVSPRVNLEYNFYPLLKPNGKGRQLIRPYIGFGIGMVMFRSKGDLLDESGNTYNYWQNGSIYAEAEGSINESEATPLERDFEYETDLRDANLDGLRKYPQTAFSLPFNAGIRFQLSKNIGINAAFSYVMNFTDMLDNVSSESVGIRQGSAGFDNHLYGSIGLSVFLGTTRPSVKPKPSFEEQVASMETPNELSVTDTENGQPTEETTNDAVDATSSAPTEVNSAETKEEDSSVPNEPSSSTDSGLENIEPEPESVTSDDSQVDSNEKQSNESNTLSLNIGDISETEPKATGEYHWADLNKDEWISPNEVLHFIDLLFEGGAVRSVEDIQNLIDYYFDQD